MKPRTRFAFSLFLYGFCAVVLQTLLARELLVVFVGNEISLGFIFCFWFLGIAIGALAARFIPGAAQKPEMYFTALMLLLAIASAALTPLLRSLGLLLALPPGQFAPVSLLALATAVTVFPISFLIGALFPLSCLAWRGSGDKTGPSQDAGSLVSAYGIDALGGLAGGVVYTFFLVHYLHHVGHGVFCTILLCAATFLPKANCRFSYQRIIAVLLFFSLIGVWNAGGLNWLENWTQEFRQVNIGTGEKEVQYLMTPYQSASLGVESEQTNLYLNGRYVVSFPDDYGDGEISTVVMSQKDDAGNVLVIGEGSEDLARYLLPFGMEQVDLVGIDGRLHNAILDAIPRESRRHFRSGRARFIEQDARRYISSCEGKYDLIWARVQDPATIAANRYFTREFYSSVRSCLKPGGVLAASATGSANYLGSELLETSGSLYSTLASAFPFVLAVPGDQHLFFASDKEDVLSSVPVVLKQRLEIKTKTKNSLDPDVLYSWYEAERLEKFRDQLVSFKGTINTDARPTAYYHNLRLWLRFTGSDSNRMLGGLFQHGPLLIPVLVFFTLALSVTVIVLRDRKGRMPEKMHGGLLAIFTTGLACFSLELILIFGFQNRFGILYQWLGALFAVYMAGTVVGACICYAIKKWIKTQRLVIISEIWVLAMAGFLLFMLEQPANAQWLFLLGNTMIGAAGGFQFAAVGAYLLPDSGQGQGLGKVSSRMEWADHLGSMAGAAFTAVILVPVLGMTGAILLLGMIKIASLSCTAWLMHPHRRKGGITSENG